MAGPVPAIHVFAATRKQDVDARAEPGHDGRIVLFTIPVQRSSTSCCIAPGKRNASCAGLTRASILSSQDLSKRMDCRVKPGNDAGLHFGLPHARQPALVAPSAR